MREGGRQGRRGEGGVRETERQGNGRGRERKHK